MNCPNCKVPLKKRGERYACPQSHCGFSADERAERLLSPSVGEKDPDPKPDELKVGKFQA